MPKPKIVEYKEPRRPVERPAANLLELLDRILDKGIVIIGDIRISVADIELLKIQIRLLIASVDKAKEMGIDFSWAQRIEGSEAERIKKLQTRVRELEGQLKTKK